MIINHRTPEYVKRWVNAKRNRYNGAYYYSIEITENIIPKIDTDRNWVLINQEMAMDHSIVFIHNNLRPDKYNWLAEYKDLILVCGIPETCERVKHLGKAVYLPLSVDVKEVECYKQPKTKNICFAGRKEKAKNIPPFPIVDYITGIPREDMLMRMAPYQECYAVGRCAIEAKVLGCELLTYDPRFPNPDFWEIVDNSEAAVMLQDILDSIDG